MSNINKQELRLTAEKAKDNFMPNLMVPTRDLLALLDELEAKDKLNAELMEKQRLIDICQGQGLEYRIAAEKRAETAEKRVAELEVLARGVKQFSEFQICHYGATEDYAKGYIDCQNNYNKVLFAAASKGE
ncbi:TPA: hypothetical protein LTW47_004472 [Enterobacter hormaechei]|nr:hypothetical protein [Enterobacter hormaechei]HBL8837642.1 hypothetical protein [Enterobacter hormaechei]HBL9039797.1 hypothetical protein [Enterobacter hormaechei]HBL9113160.1 hypothetical protein [Enterobacter hormaechei]